MENCQIVVFAIIFDVVDPSLGALRGKAPAPKYSFFKTFHSAILDVGLCTDGEIGATAQIFTGSGLGGKSSCNRAESIHFESPNKCGGLVDFVVGIDVVVVVY